MHPIYKTLISQGYDEKFARETAEKMQVMCERIDQKCFWADCQSDAVSTKEQRFDGDYKTIKVCSRHNR